MIEMAYFVCPDHYVHGPCPKGMLKIRPLKSGQIFYLSHKMRNVLERMQKQFSDYLSLFFVNEFFILSFWDRDFCEPDSETLTNDTQ